MCVRVRASVCVCVCVRVRAHVRACVRVLMCAPYDLSVDVHKIANVGTRSHRRRFSRKKANIHAYAGRKPDIGESSEGRRLHHLSD